jgi:adenylate kinase family enzyme
MMEYPTCGQRIHVVGTTGSGKTTTASHVAARLEVTHVELDALHWQPNWTEAPLHVFRQRTQEALSGDAWVVDGNYSKVRDIVWARADTIVWLDYPLPLILWQLAVRTFRRVFLREELWNRNRETLRTALFSRDSLFLWALKTYRRRRQEYPRLFNLPQHAHLNLIHLTSPGKTRTWIDNLLPQNN